MGDEIFFDFSLEINDDDIRFSKDLVRLLRLFLKIKKRKEKKIQMETDILKYIRDKKILMKEIAKIT